MIARTLLAARTLVDSTGRAVEVFRRPGLDLAGAPHRGGGGACQVGQAEASLRAIEQDRRPKRLDQVRCGPALLALVEAVGAVAVDALSDGVERTVELFQN